MTAKVNKPLSPPEGQRQKSPPPQLSRDEISRRNARIMALFIAGHSEREIGRAVNLTGQRVHQIIKVELKNEARHQKLVTDQALSLYMSRLDMLLKAVWPKVAQQDLKAIETARRLLEQQARLYDIEEERVGALPPANELLDGDEGGVDPRDDLAKYRSRHARGGDSVVHPEVHAEAT